jgi:hypothetical protein
MEVIPYSMDLLLLEVEKVLIVTMEVKHHPVVLVVVGVVCGQEMQMEINQDMPVKVVAEGMVHPLMQDVTQRVEVAVAQVELVQMQVRQ